MDTETEEDPECHLCPGETYVFPGAIGDESCIDKPTCDEHDYEVEYSLCKNGKRTATYKLQNPAKCIEPTNPVKTTEEVNCAACPVGSHEVNVSGGYTRCEYCSENQIFKDNKCQKCPAGTEATNIFAINKNVYEWPEFFSTWCTSSNPGIEMCHFNKGWKMEDGVIHSGKNNDFLVNVVLQMEFDVDYDETALVTLNLTGEQFGS